MCEMTNLHPLHCICSEICWSPVTAYSSNRAISRSPCIMAASILTGAVLVAVIAGEILTVHNKKAVFTFPEFPYKETIKNEMIFREYESACEQSPTCIHMSGIAHLRCLRECVSPSCYQDIYQSDQLEEGEIDVRLNSFKGCFVQRASRPRP